DPARAPLIGLRVEGERAGLDVVPDGGAGRDVGVVADRDRRDQLAVAADLHAVADHRAVLAEAVVVAGDRARTDVAVAADGRVADVREVVRLGAGADLRLLHLDEVADVDALVQDRAGPELRERSDDRAGADP